MKRSVFAFCLALATLSFPMAAWAQDDADAAAEAKRQYQAGTQAYAAKRYNEAALAFEAAAAYKANAVTLYTAALSWDYANAPERAADAYSRALDAQGLTPQQQSTAKERLGLLEKTMGILTVTGPEGFKVQLDSLTATTVPARLHASAGVHTLVVRGASGTPDKRDVTLELGQATAVDVTPKAAAPIEPLPPTKPPADAKVVRVEVVGAPRLSWKKAVGFSALGLGVMAGVSGIVLGLSAQDAGDAYNANPSRAALDRANGLATWATVAWVTGGVLLVAGITFVLLPDKAPSKDPDKKPNLEAPPTEPALGFSPSLGGAVLRGTF